MIVKNRNAFNVSDHRHPVLLTNTDYRTATFRGHALYPSHGTNDSICDHPPVERPPRGNIYDYGTQYNRFHSWKYSQSYEDAKYNLPARLQRVDFMKNFGERLQLHPVSKIDEYQTIQRQDFTAKPLPGQGPKPKNSFVRQTLKPIFRGNSNDSSFHKHQDPYLTTQDLNFTLLTNPEEIKITQKDHIITWDWLKYPKTSKGYGLKEFPDVKAMRMKDSFDRIPPTKHKIPIQNRFPETGSSFTPPLRKYKQQDVYPYWEITSSAPRDCPPPMPESKVYGGTEKNVHLVGLRAIPQQRR